MKSITIVFSLLVFTFAVSAKAAPLLNGLALEQQFNKEVYIAAIYSESLSSDSSGLLNSSEARRLEVRVLANSLPARRFRNQWMEGIAINNRGDVLSSQAETMVTFANLFTGRFLRGDQLAIDFAPDTSITTVSLNGITLGVINDPEFFNTLLRAWIGSVPPSTDFREGLLAGGDIDADLLATFETLAPSNERIATLQLKQVSQEEAVAATQETEENKALPKPTLAAVELAPPTMTLAPEVAAAAGVAQAGDSESQAQPEDEPVELVETDSQPAVSSQEEAPGDEELIEEEDDMPLTADLILARQIYTSALLRHTFENTRYPKRAQERGQEGSVRLNVVIDSEGNVLDIQAIQESRYGILNRAARAAVERAEPYPAVPSKLKMEKYSFTLPITFNLPD